MRKLLLIAIFFPIGVFAQYSPEFNLFYEKEIALLKANYAENEIEQELDILYSDWLKNIKKEKEILAQNQGNPVNAQKLEDLGNLEEFIIRAQKGETSAKPPTEEIVELVETPEPLVPDNNNVPKAEPNIPPPADTIPPEPPAIQENETLANDPEIEEISEIKLEEVKSPEEEITKPELTESTNEIISETPVEVKENTPNKFNESAKVSSPKEVDMAKLFASELPDVYFRVQVFAANRAFSGAEISNRLKLNESIIEEQDQGLYKYLVGKFSYYNSARARADELRETTGIEAFVVGYYQEKRTPLNLIFKAE